MKQKFYIIWSGSVCSTNVDDAAEDRQFPFSLRCPELSEVILAEGKAGDMAGAQSAAS
jgi:hypothetical protein